MRWCLLLALLVGCPAPVPDDPDPVGDGQVDADPLVVGDWSRYPAASGETWPTAPLDDERWARVTAELACAGRSRRGDPDAHRRAAEAILQEHKTTAGAVMDHGIEVNADPTRALRLGERVAAAAEACP